MRNESNKRHKSRSGLSPDDSFVVADRPLDHFFERNHALIEVNALAAHLFAFALFLPIKFFGVGRAPQFIFATTLGFGRQSLVAHLGILKLAQDLGKFVARERALLRQGATDDFENPK